MTDAAREAALVLACARISPDSGELSRIRSSSAAPLDWDVATRLAIRHGLGPLMHVNLAAAGVEPPRAAGAALWARAQWAKKRGENMSDELERIVAAMAEAGVAMVSFKGPLLAERLYGDAGLRESGDLDCIVRPDDVRRAREVLESLGYALDVQLDPERERLWLLAPGRHELGFRHARRAVLVELQWRANPDLDVPAIGDEQWWRHAPTRMWRGLALTTIPPEEELLALLVHGTKHMWGSLDWLVDIAQLARDDAAGWAALPALARRHRAERRAALGIELAKRLLDAPIPQAAGEMVRSANVAALAERITPALLHVEYEPPGIGEALRLQMAARDGFLQRVSCLLGWMRPTPGDWDWLRLPRALSSAYLLVRPVRLAWKYLFTRRSRQTPAAATPRTPRPPRHSTG